MAGIHLKPRSSSRKLACENLTYFSWTWMHLHIDFSITTCRFLQTPFGRNLSRFLPSTVNSKIVMTMWSGCFLRWSAKCPLIKFLLALTSSPLPLLPWLSLYKHIHTNTYTSLPLEGQCTKLIKEMIFHSLQLIGKLYATLQMIWCQCAFYATQEMLLSAHGKIQTWLFSFWGLTYLTNL